MFKFAYEDLLPPAIAEDVLSHFEGLFREMTRSSLSAAESHKRTIESLGIDWRDKKSNIFCIWCIRNSCQHTLTCGHSICDLEGA